MAPAYCVEVWTKETWIITAPTGEEARDIMVDGDRTHPQATQVTREVRDADVSPIPEGGTR